MNVEYSRCWWFGREKAVTACALPESTDLEILRNYIRTILKSNLKSVIHYCR